MDAKTIDITQSTDQLEFNLVVVQPFSDFQRGAIITDTQTINEVLDGENAHFCNKISKREGE